MGLAKSSITEIQVTPIKPRDGLVGFASIVYDKNLYLGSIGIFTRPSGGYRLAYPTKASIQLFHPINKEAAADIEREIVSKFIEVSKK